ncbi:MAG: hypothetical protein DMF79_17010 [Acidobacteria bacterium]|nr:MAG: hypothetical protein DMF79_17010 [Acidobacteriota bacterium]
MVRVPHHMTPNKPTAAAKGRSARRSPRVAIQLKASLLGRGVVTLVDLSLLGCLARGERHLDPGSILDLRLDLDGRPFTAKVKVVESSMDGTSLSEPRPRYLVGLEFLSLPADEELRLRSFLEEERRRRQRARPSPP